ncbi:MAG: hypothetical protein PVI59_04365 [Anaerolineae bacterium]|jgi:DNA-binding response OmpR family regulator
MVYKIENQVGPLRSKLEPNAANLQLARTLRGLGYSFITCS